MICSIYAWSRHTATNKGTLETQSCFPVAIAAILRFMQSSSLNYVNVGYGRAIHMCNLLPVIIISECLAAILVVALKTAMSNIAHCRTSPALIWCLIPRVLGGRRSALSAEATTIQIEFSRLTLGGINLIIIWPWLSLLRASQLGSRTPGLIPAPLCSASIIECIS